METGRKRIVRAEKLRMEDRGWCRICGRLFGAGNWRGRDVRVLREGLFGRLEVESRELCGGLGKYISLSSLAMKWKD